MDMRARYRQVKLGLLDKGAYICDLIGMYLHKPGDFFYRLASKLAIKWHEEQGREAGRDA